MLLKRCLVLAAGVVLFIAVFILYFNYSRAQMETRFRAEREKFGVEGVILTASSSNPAPIMPAPTPSAAADTNTLIGPVPPPTPPATDNTTTPTAPVTPDTNSAPTTPDPNSAPATPSAPSTMDAPNAGPSPLFQLASYRPSDAAEIQLANALPGAVVDSVANPAVAPATNAVYPGVAAPTSSEAAPIPATTPSPSSTTKNPASQEGSVIVLLFHQFKAAGVAIPTKFQWTMNADVFASEMKYIHDNGYNVISMDQLLKFIKHQGTVPPRAVCITIDDGYKSAIVYAAPILKQYGYPWTFFIYPDFITVAEGSGAASWNDLLQLQSQGIDIECHSMTHPNLKLHHQKVKGVWQNFTPDQYAAWLNNETAGAKAILEQHLGRKVTCFAYPYGEYNKQVEDAVIAAGFEAIFTVADNPVHSTTDIHSIGRYTITQGVEKNFAAYLRQGALGLANADPAPGATITDPRPVITATLGYAGTLDPKSIETSVRDFGDVRHDFDPQTNTIRLYLPRDLIAPVVLVNIRVKDASTGQVMVANWHFNYEPGTPASPTTHAPIAPAPPATPPTTSASPAVPTTTTTASIPTEKNASGTMTAPQ
jgi:peptidoglycan/xylan/chitin deacetylase (PgdA/CDA1 family)